MAKKLQKTSVILRNLIDRVEYLEDHSENLERANNGLQRDFDRTIVPLQKERDMYKKKYYEEKRKTKAIKNLLKNTLLSKISLNRAIKKLTTIRQILDL